MTTPLALKYSVLGWNHPGFGGSTVCTQKFTILESILKHSLLQGRPYPPQDQNAIDAIMQFAIHKLGFLPENIILFGWSIGAYPSLYAATQYPNVKGVVSRSTSLQSA